MARPTSRLRLERLDRRDVPAAVPVGPEFVVNSAPGGSQDRSAVAVDGAGNVAVAWESLGQDGNLTGIYLQRYTAGGAKIGGELQVNVYTIGAQQTPAVAADAVGNVVVVWSSASGQDGSRDGVYLRRYSPTGVAGPETRVNTYTSNRQSQPSIAMDPNGDFVVAWSSYGQDGSQSGVYAQRFDSTGAKLGAELAVNTTTVGQQQHPAVGIDGSANFVIAWESLDQPSAMDYGIYAQRFNAAGTKLGGEFHVNSTTTADQLAPAIASGTAGNFAIVWQTAGQDGSGWGIAAQRFDTAGAKLGSEMLVNSTTTGDQMGPKLSADASGNFAVVWSSSAQDGSGLGVFGQRYSAAGVLLQGEFRANATTTGDQATPAIGGNPGGDFVVAWQGAAPAGSGGTGGGILAQRFSVPPLAQATITLDQGGKQRSTLRDITLAFNTLVTMDSNAISVMGLSGPRSYTLDWSASTFTSSIVKVVFSGADLDRGSLPNGYYSYAISAAGIRNYDGIMLDGNNDGLAGGDSSMSFHRLAGDLNGDRWCDANDVTQFLNYYGTSGPSAYGSGADFDSSGAVDANDVTLFLNAYGRVLS